MIEINYTKTVGVADAAMTIGGTSFTPENTTATYSGGLVTFTDGVETAKYPLYELKALGVVLFTDGGSIENFIALLATTPNVFGYNVNVDFTTSGDNVTIGDTGVTIPANGASFTAKTRNATGLNFETVHIDVTGGETFTILQARNCFLNGDDISPSARVVVAALSAANTFTPSVDALTPQYDISSMTVSRAISATESLVLVNISAAATATLPAASTLTPGQYIRLKDIGGNLSTNTLTIATAGGNIDGNASIEITKDYASYDFLSDGTNYFIL